MAARLGARTAMVAKVSVIPVVTMVLHVQTYKHVRSKSCAQGRLATTPVFVL